MFATHIAERKLYQLRLAKDLGLNIPVSLVSNNRDRVLAFLQSHKECIIKPISNGLQVLKDRSYSIYTTPVSAVSLGL